MVKDDSDESNHTHSAVNAKTYCNQGKIKWKDLSLKCSELDVMYDKKILELGNLCSSLFKNMAGPS